MFRLFQNMSNESNIHKQQLNSELNLHRPRFEGTFFWYTQPRHGMSWASLGVSRYHSPLVFPEHWQQPRRLSAGASRSRRSRSGQRLVSSFTFIHHGRSGKLWLNIFKYPGGRFCLLFIDMYHSFPQGA